MAAVHAWEQIGLMTFGSILAFVLQRYSPTTFDISPGGYMCCFGHFASWQQHTDTSGATKHQIGISK